jgi:hypothetical protein
MVGARTDFVGILSCFVDTGRFLVCTSEMGEGVPSPHLQGGLLFVLRLDLDLPYGRFLASLVPSHSFIEQG